MSESKRTKIVELLKKPELTGIGNSVTVKGWVRTKRGNKNVAFIALNDGSTIHSIQVVVDLANFDEELLKPVTTGACVSITGILVESPAAGQSVEIHATAL